MGAGLENLEEIGGDFAIGRQTQYNLSACLSLSVCVCLLSLSLSLCVCVSSLSLSLCVCVCCFYEYLSAAAQSAYLSNGWTVSDVVVVLKRSKGATYHHQWGSIGMRGEVSSG